MLESVLSHKCRSYIVSTHIVLCLTCSRVRYRVVSCVREYSRGAGGGRGHRRDRECKCSSSGVMRGRVHRSCRACSKLCACVLCVTRAEPARGGTAGATAHAAVVPPDTASAGLARAVEMFEYESG